MSSWYPILAVLVSSLACAYLRVNLRQWSIVTAAAFIADGRFLQST